MNKIFLEVKGLTYSNSQSGAYALILNKKGDKMYLPIIIGEAEAQSIAIALEGHKNIRPLTHDLFMTFATTFDIDIEEVVINKFKEGLFYSELHCMKDGELTIIDARPSDAIALAVRFKCPVYTYSQVLEEAGLIKQVAKDGVKVLGNGELKVALTVVADKFTKSAVEKIEAAGGKAEVI